LSLAKGAGYRVTDEVYNKGITYLQTQLSQSRVSDYETKAVLLHALAAATAPKSRGSSTSGGKKSVVLTRARSGASR